MRPSLFTVTFGCVLAAAGAFLLYLRAEPARFVASREQAHQAKIQPGDILLQDLDCGARCELIRQVTKSRYAHTGIVLRDGDDLVVWEAFHPVGPTPLGEWVERGRNEQFAVYRPDAELLSRLPQIEAAVRAMAGRPYDADYQWDDERIYCSELIAKALNKALGQAVFPPHPIGAEALGSKAETIRSMSHGRITAQTELVSPADLTHSPRLRRVFDELGN